MIGNRPHTGLERPWLVLRAAGDTVRRLTPVVEHLRNVSDAAGSFGQAQYEVVVLGTVEAISEPTDQLDERAPCDEQVGDVVLAAQTLG